MKIFSLLIFIASLLVNVSVIAQADEPQQEQQPTMQSKIRDAFDEYTTYLKEEFIDTYHGLGELGADFIADVVSATDPVSSVLVTGVSELGILAQDGYETLKLELSPLGTLITSARKKLEEFASNMLVHNT